MLNQGMSDLQKLLNLICTHMTLFADKLVQWGYQSLAGDCLYVRNYCINLNKKGVPFLNSHISSLVRLAPIKQLSY